MGKKTICLICMVFLYMNIYIKCMYVLYMFRKSSLTMYVNFGVTYEWWWWLINWMVEWCIWRPVSAITVPRDSGLRHRTTETETNFTLKI